MESTTISPTTLRDLEVLTGHGVADGFYLAGGTGLAMHLGHRESHDLDFFYGDSFDEDALVEDIAGAGSFAVEKKENRTVRGKFRDTLISFFTYPYPLLQPCVSAFGVQVASVPDIACMKLDAMASRGAKRDFIDLYMIIHKTGLPLSHLFKLFTEKYAAIDYNLMHIKKGLVYFADADHEPLPLMPIPIAWDTIKDFFIAEAGKL